MDTAAIRQKLSEQADKLYGPERNRKRQVQVRAEPQEVLALLDEHCPPGFESMHENLKTRECTHVVLTRERLETLINDAPRLAQSSERTANVPGQREPNVVDQA